MKYLGIVGDPGNWRVYVETNFDAPHHVPRRDLLPERFDLYNHSPDGFSWGYEGSGPAQLALAIIAHYLNTNKIANADRIAVDLHQAYKLEVVSQWPTDFEWELDGGDVDTWVANKLASRSPKDQLEGAHIEIPPLVPDPLTTESGTVNKSIMQLIKSLYAPLLLHYQPEDITKEAGKIPVTVAMLGQEYAIDCVQWERGHAVIRLEPDGEL
jgi:hypothetical protein